MMTMPRHLLPFALLALTAAIAGLLPACSTLTSYTPPDMDADSERVLRAMSDKIAAADRFSFKAHDQFDSTLVTHLGVPEHADIEVLVARPNKFRANVRLSDTGAQTVHFNGSQLAIHHTEENAYATAPIRKRTLDGALKKIATHHGFTPPLTDFILKDPFRAMTTDMTSGRYVGKETVNGKPCEHVAFTGKDLNWDLWVGADDSLPHRYVITVTLFGGNPKFQADFKNWNLNAQFSDNIFEFTPPEGAEQLPMASEAGFDSLDD